MKSHVLFAAASLLLASTLPGSAQVKVDMNQVTCGDMLGYNQDSRDFVRAWMSGYYSAAANRNVLDYSRLQRNSTKVMAYCKKHKSDTLPTAIKKIAS